MKIMKVVLVLAIICLLFLGVAYKARAAEWQKSSWDAAIKLVPEDELTRVVRDKKEVKETLVLSGDNLARANAYGYDPGQKRPLVFNLVEMQGKKILITGRVPRESVFVVVRWHRDTGKLELVPRK